MEGLAQRPPPATKAHGPATSPQQPIDQAQQSKYQDPPTQSQSQSQHATPTPLSTVMPTAATFNKFPPVPSGPIKPIKGGLDADTSTSTDDASVTSEENDRRAASVVSMDDPDVRIAAEALGDLRADFISSPPEQHMTLPKSSFHASSDSGSNGERRPSQQPEPLLSLLTTSHPLISTAISGSLSAYSTSKSYSPRFKSSAEFVERHIGTPVASTVETVGRRTGVEGGVRWWLGSRRSSAVHQSEDEEESEGAHKRRKISNATNGSMDLERGLYSGLHEYGQRRPSQLSFESLPAYDDNRSPNYEAQGALVKSTESEDSRQTTPSSTWQSRLMLSTSGLGVAMSDESLRSLKYCLTWLRWANVHLGKVIIALKNVVDEWDQSQQQSATAEAEPVSPTAKIANGEKSSDSSKSLIVKAAENEAALSRRIQALKGDVLQTLKKVVDIVSKYAGGALPENARLLVRRHLTSLPQRFQLAATSPPTTDSLQPASETVSSANRVMVLAREGLDMMAQVSGVLDGTIVSAEEWCDRLGRRKRGETEDTDETPMDEKARLQWGESDGHINGGDVRGDVRGDVKTNGDIPMVNGNDEKTAAVQY